MNGYVDELHEESGESIHNEEIRRDGGNLLRQNRKDNQIHPYLLLKDVRADRSTEVEKTFLPSTTSMRDPCHSESRRH